jgi:hypothetical protein
MGRFTRSGHRHFYRYMHIELSLLACRFTDRQTVVVTRKMTAIGTGLDRIEDLRTTSWKRAPLWIAYHCIDQDLFIIQKRHTLDE